MMTLKGFIMSPFDRKRHVAGTASLLANAELMLKRLDVGDHPRRENHKRFFLSIPGSAQE